MISVIVPTIPGRERWLERCLASYAGHQVIVVRGFDNCGAAWNHGAEQATGDYLHFTADDIELAAPLDEACEVADSGRIPAPLVLNTDGTVQSCGGAFGEPVPDDGTEAAFTTVPLLTRRMWERIAPFPSIHYGTDNFVTIIGARYGWPTVNCHGYRLIHHMAPEGRNEARMSADMRALDTELGGTR